MPNSTLPSSHSALTSSYNMLTISYKPINSLYNMLTSSYSLIDMAWKDTTLHTREANKILTGSLALVYVRSLIGGLIRRLKQGLYNKERVNLDARGSKRAYPGFNISTQVVSRWPKNFLHFPKVSFYPLGGLNDQPNS
jgi:hypothetical protein